MFTILVYDIKLVIYNQVMTKQYKQTVNCAPVFRSFSLSFSPLPSLSLLFPFSLLCVSFLSSLFLLLLSSLLFSFPSIFFLFSSPLLCSLPFSSLSLFVQFISSLLYFFSPLYFFTSPPVSSPLYFSAFFSFFHFSLFLFSPPLLFSLLSYPLPYLLFSFLPFHPLSYSIHTLIYSIMHSAI